MAALRLLKFFCRESSCRPCLLNRTFSTEIFSTETFLPIAPRRVFGNLPAIRIFLPPIRQGMATKSTKGAKRRAGFCVFCAFCGQPALMDSWRPSSILHGCRDSFSRHSPGKRGIDFWPKRPPHVACMVNTHYDTAKRFSPRQVASK